MYDITQARDRQGCSKAAMGAITLDGMLRKKPFCDSTSIIPGFGRLFFKRQCEVLEPLWEGTKPVDYLFPKTKPIEGETLSKGRSQAAIGNLLMEVATFVRFMRFSCQFHAS